MSEITKIYPGEVFADSRNFDIGIRQLLPHYDDMLDALTACVPSQTHRLLELGCGTGELSLKLLKHCPEAHLVAIDYSPRMIERVTSKLTEAQLEHRVTLIQGDFGTWTKGEMSDQIGTRFDACVSSLAIHHLTDEMKQQLFAQIQQSLEAGGCFWNADPILQELPQLTDAYQSLREQWTQAQGTTLAEVRSQLGTSEPQGYSGQDRLASLDTHLNLLSDVGFQMVAVPWRFFGLAVFGGWV